MKILTKVLKTNLHSLEDSDLITRKMYLKILPRVRYSLIKLRFKSVLIFYLWGGLGVQIGDQKSLKRTKEKFLMIIQKAQKKDLQQILDLQYLAYQSEARLVNNPHIPPLKQTIDDIEKEFENGILLKVIDEDDIIIGSVRVYSQNGTSYIGKLIVHPDFQGQGIGTKLLKETEQIYSNRRYELFTSSKSTRNIKLYEKLGYRIFLEKNISDNLKFIYLEKTI